MNWHHTIALLTGAAQPELPPATGSRVHYTDPDNPRPDDDPTLLTPADLVARLGICRAAAKYRLADARRTRDYSRLLKPAHHSAKSTTSKGGHKPSSR